MASAAARAPEVRFRCPHCQATLDPTTGGVQCAAGHRFDRAAEGYLNLLPSGRKAGRPAGDSAEMLRARRAVFDAGHYDPVIATVAAMVGDPDRVLDAGCGEGAYIGAISAAQRGAITAAQRIGIDVSKPAIRMAARRYRDCAFAVASSYALPFHDAAFDTVISVFAPRAFGEFSRVLRPGGTTVTVSPAPDHLAGLTTLLYGEPRPHDERPHTDPSTEFAPEAVERVRFAIDLSGDDALLLLQMTPYWWRADAAQRAAVASRPRVDTVVDVWVARHRA